MRLLVSFVVALAVIGTGPRAHAEDPGARPLRPHRLVDAGVRFGYARPVGAFDVGTRAGDTSHGGAPVALDVAVRIGSPAAWNVFAGVFVSWAETIPRLCGSASECVGSLGHDVDLALMARVRGPSIAFVLPEGEIGAGWSWSSRSLVDNDITSTRTWNGPLLLRAALVPELALGSRTRLGLVVGGSVARSTSFHVEAPGLDRRGIDAASVHGTIDIGIRLAADFFD